MAHGCASSIALRFILFVLAILLFSSLGIIVFQLVNLLFQTRLITILFTVFIYEWKQGFDGNVYVVGMAEIQCRSKCEDQPNCDEFCRRIGFWGGKCFPPFYQFCCCQKWFEIKCFSLWTTKSMALKFQYQLFFLFSLFQVVSLLIIRKIKMCYSTFDIDLRSTYIYGKTITIDSNYIAATF